MTPERKRKLRVSLLMFSDHHHHQIILINKSIRHYYVKMPPKLSNVNRKDVQLNVVKCYRNVVVSQKIWMA